MSHIFKQFCAPLKRRPPAMRGQQGLLLRHWFADVALSLTRKIDGPPCCTGRKSIISRNNSTVTLLWIRNLLIGGGLMSTGGLLSGFLDSAGFYDKLWPLSGTNFWPYSSWKIAGYDRICTQITQNLKYRHFDTSSNFYIIFLLTVFS